MRFSKDNNEKIISYKGVNLKFLENGLFINFGHDNDTDYSQHIVYSYRNSYSIETDAKKEYNISHIYWRLMSGIFMLILPSICVYYTFNSSLLNNKIFLAYYLFNMIKMTIIIEHLTILMKFAKLAGIKNKSIAFFGKMINRMYMLGKYNTIFENFISLITFIIDCLIMMQFYNNNKYALFFNVFSIITFARLSMYLYYYRYKVIMILLCVYYLIRHKINF
jgi:hypothetical protein